VVPADLRPVVLLVSAAPTIRNILALSRRTFAARRRIPCSRQNTADQTIPVRGQTAWISRQRSRNGEEPLGRPRPQGEQIAVYVAEATSHDEAPVFVPDEIDRWRRRKVSPSDVAVF